MKASIKLARVRDIKTDEQSYRLFINEIHFIEISFTQFRELLNVHGMRARFDEELLIGDKMHYFYS